MQRRRLVVDSPLPLFRGGREPARDDREGVRHVATYVVLLMMRVLLAYAPGGGYMHPDEFFQGPEVMAGAACAPICPVLAVVVHLIEYWNIFKMIFISDRKTGIIEAQTQPCAACSRK